MNAFKVAASHTAYSMCYISYNEVYPCKDTDCLAPVPRPPDESGHVTGGPRELPLHPLHSWRDTCNEEHLAELRVKCQVNNHTLLP